MVFFGQKSKNKESFLRNNNASEEKAIGISGDIAYIAYLLSSIGPMRALMWDIHHQRIYGKSRWGPGNGTAWKAPLNCGPSS